MTVSVGRLQKALRLIIKVLGTLVLLLVNVGIPVHEPVPLWTIKIHPAQQLPHKMTEFISFVDCSQLFSIVHSHVPFSSRSSC